MASVPQLSQSPFAAQSAVDNASAAGGAGLVPLTLALSEERGRLAASAPTSGGGYEIELHADGRARVHAEDLPSLARLEALITTASSADARKVPALQRLVDKPVVPVRAVLECFYGALWTLQERAAVVAGAAEHGANAYVYGPSADARTGGAWRDFYTGRAREVLAALIADLHERGMFAIWRVSPMAPVDSARAMRMADRSERAALAAKVEDMMRLGFDRVLVAFDDIPVEALPEELGEPHPLAAAQSKVISDLAGQFGAPRIMFCPTHYFGTRSSRYRQDVAALLPSEIEICWTGPEVISPEIDAASVEKVRTQLQRDPWLWDNYPVNDWDLSGLGDSILTQQGGLDNMVTPRRLPLAPLRGRSPAVAPRLAGYGANAAIGAHSGLPALRTALEWAWLGEHYEPNQAWAAATARLSAGVEAIEILADAAGSAPGAPRSRAGALERSCAELLLAAGSDTEPEAARAVADEVRRHVAAIGRFREAPDEFTAAVRPWLLELARQCEFASLAARALGGEVHRSALSGPLRQALQHPSEVSMCSGVPRALAEFVRGCVSGGVPDVPA